MAKRGQRKFICADCTEEFFMYASERRKRSRARCPACGSIRIDPASPGANEQVVGMNRNAVEFGHLSKGSANIDGTRHKG